LQISYYLINKNKVLLTLFLLFFYLSAHASDQVQGNPVDYISPNGIKEQCVILSQIPNGVYSDNDHKTEKFYCSLNIYSNTGLCPKTWSTSPGTILYPLENSSYSSSSNSSIASFEKTACHNQRKIAIKSVVFKSTMNMKDTSGTFSTASLLYYHFSRYFNTQIKVPVAVYRSFDKNEHNQRVSKVGVSNTHKGLIKHAWKDMLKVESNPSLYKPVSELFTQDKKQIYGILIRSTGKRYNPIINGTRQSGWGNGQSHDFQETPAFLALRSSKPLKQSIKEGITKARLVPKMSKAMRNVSQPQVAFWMLDIIEITLLDYIFSQQDRIGNIDYTITSKNGVKIKQTHLNDNDAAGRMAYANYTKKTAMLEKINHYKASTYKKLIALDKDFQAKGSLYQYLSNTFGLSKKQINMIVKNTKMATKIIQDKCLSGKLIFDLEPDEYLLNDTVEVVKVSCSQ
jgi:hypothetical protein